MGVASLIFQVVAKGAMLPYLVPDEQPDGE